MIIENRQSPTTDAIRQMQDRKGVLQKQKREGVVDGDTASLEIVDLQFIKERLRTISGTVYNQKW